MSRTPALSARAGELDKSVGNKFPKFTNSYPNPGPGAPAPTFAGRASGWGVRRACNTGLCELFTGFGRDLSHFSAD